jgi:hypothetical protein
MPVRQTEGQDVAMELEVVVVALSYLREQLRSLQQIDHLHATSVTCEALRKGSQVDQWMPVLTLDNLQVDDLPC